MKKFFISTVMVFAFSALAVGQVKGYDFMTKLDQRKTYQAISQYVGANFDQHDAMKVVFSTSASKMGKAIEANDEAQVQKALNFNLANMRAILSKEQYRKYLTLLNVSYYNKQNLLAVKK